MTEPLKPCPFCPPHLSCPTMQSDSFETGVVEKDAVYSAWVRCNGCDAPGPVAEFDEDAARLWNTRTSEHQPTNDSQPVELAHWTEAHSGPGWYWYPTEYPDEGSVGPYATRAEAVADLANHDSTLSDWAQLELAKQLDSRTSEREAIAKMVEERIGFWERNRNVHWAPTKYADELRNVLHDIRAGCFETPKSPECPGPNCPMCNGEACNLCGAGCWGKPSGRCEHDTVERHSSAGRFEGGGDRG